VRVLVFWEVVDLNIPTAVHDVPGDELRGQRSQDIIAIHVSVEREKACLEAPGVIFQAASLVGLRPEPHEHPARHHGQLTQVGIVECFGLDGPNARHYAVLRAFTTLSAGAFAGRRFRAFTTGGSTCATGPLRPTVSCPHA
jgi:hypothetical protein